MIELFYIGQNLPHTHSYTYIIHTMLLWPHRRHRIHYLPYIAPNIRTFLSFSLSLHISSFSLLFYTIQWGEAFEIAWLVIRFTSSGPYKSCDDVFLTCFLVIQVCAVLRIRMWVCGALVCLLANRKYFSAERSSKIEWNISRNRFLQTHTHTEQNTKLWNYFSISLGTQIKCHPE